MNEAIEADLLAARLAPGQLHDEPAWIDLYVGARARLDPTLTPGPVVEAARVAWCSHGWAHPAAVAFLEHELGTIVAD